MADSLSAPMTDREAECEALRRFGPNAYITTEYARPERNQPERCCVFADWLDSPTGVGSTWEEALADAQARLRSSTTSQ